MSDECQGCFAGREGRYYRLGLALCWVCVIRSNLPLWGVRMLDWIDRSGSGKP